MPAVAPSATIVLTGASGFTGSWITKALLEAGYKVRGTVRSTSKADYLKNLFKSHGDKFEPIIIEDISAVGAFDKAFDHDVEGVMCIAGAVPPASNIIATNVDGLLNLTRSIDAHGPNVKRFVYMSSAQAMLGKPLTHIYTEDDWNDGAVDAFEKNDQTDPMTMYSASKVLAERNLIDLAKKNITYDVVRMVPVFIFGPIIHECNSLQSLNLSSSLMYQYLTTPREKEKVNDYASDYIDVRDLADAFVAALQTPEAGGEHFILDAGAFTFQNLYNAFHSKAPEVTEVPTGDPESKFAFPGAFCNAEKAIKTLHLKPFRGLPEVAFETYQSIKGKM